MFLVGLCRVWLVQIRVWGVGLMLKRLAFPVVGIGCHGFFDGLEFTFLCLCFRL